MHLLVAKPNKTHVCRNVLTSCSSEVVLRRQYFCSGNESCAVKFPSVPYLEKYYHKVRIQSKTYADFECDNEPNNETYEMVTQHFCLSDMLLKIELKGLLSSECNSNSGETNVERFINKTMKTGQNSIVRKLRKKMWGKRKK